MYPYSFWCPSTKHNVFPVWWHPSVSCLNVFSNMSTNNFYSYGIAIRPSTLTLWSYKSYWSFRCWLFNKHFIDGKFLSEIVLLSFTKTYLTSLQNRVCSFFCIWRNWRIVKSIWVNYQTKDLSKENYWGLSHRMSVSNICLYDIFKWLTDTLERENRSKLMSD